MTAYEENTEDKFSSLEEGLMSVLHTPVMFKECLEYLNLSPGKVVVDGTIGTGAHSEGILERILPGGRLIGIDRDEESLEKAKKRLSGFSGAAEFVYANFADLDKVLEKLNINSVDGVLLDLGVSSFQLDNPERGFSFRQEGPLDMRLDRNSYILAYDLVNNLNEEEISEVLWLFGEERWHRRIARAIVQERSRTAIATTSMLADIVSRAIPSRYRSYRIHPATRTFQAIRIAVNRELEALESAVVKAIDALAANGRIVVISFHSLEDRIVKLAFRKAQAEGMINIITPKPLTPSEAEVSNNPPSRSAKLRVAEKII